MLAALHFWKPSGHELRIHHSVVLNKLESEGLEIDRAAAVAYMRGKKLIPPPQPSIAPTPQKDS